MIKCFAPLVDDQCTILILGSMPGVRSLDAQQYYAHPRNYFWKILYSLFDESDSGEYEKRKEFLQRHHIALWDVIKDCEREGSLDTDISDEEVNDFNTFFRSYPNIKKVFFNGSKAYETFKKKVGFKYEGISFHKLTSTSPANAIKFEKKRESWEQIRK